MWLIEYSFQFDRSAQRTASLKVPLWGHISFRDDRKKIIWVSIKSVKTWKIEIRKYRAYRNLDEGLRRNVESNVRDSFRLFNTNKLLEFIDFLSDIDNSPVILDIFQFENLQFSSLL